MPGYEDENVHCSFCGATKEDVDLLISGAGVYICENCVHLCAKMLEEKCGCAVPIRRVGPVLGIHLGLDVISAIWRDPEK